MEPSKSPLTTEPSLNGCHAQAAAVSVAGGYKSMAGLTCDLLLVALEALYLAHGANVEQLEHLIAASTQNPIAVLVPLDRHDGVLVRVTEQLLSTRTLGPRTTHMVAMFCALFESHNLIRLSLLPDTMSELCGCQLTSFTSQPWPVSTLSCVCVAKSQIFSVTSSEHDANLMSVGQKLRGVSTCHEGEYIAVRT